MKEMLHMVYHENSAETNIYSAVVATVFPSCFPIGPPLLLLFLYTIYIGLRV